MPSRHKKRVIQHLLHAGVAKDETQAAAIAKKTFSHFTKLAVEFFKLDQIVNPGNISDYVSFSGSEKSRELFFSPGKSKPVIIVTAHLGNWELAGFIYTIFSGLPLLSVARTFNNPKIDAYIRRHRVAHNHSVCPKDGALKSLLGALKKGYSVSVVADQHASSTEGVETIFFGHPARTHASPALLHLRTGIPIMVGINTKENDEFKFNLILSDPICLTPTGDKESDLKQLAQRYTSEIERIVSMYPEQWLWAHRRWLDINRKGRCSAIKRHVI